MQKTKIILACENLIMCYDLTVSFKNFDVIRVKNSAELELMLVKEAVTFIFISVARGKLSEEILNTTSLISIINKHPAKKIGFTTYSNNELRPYKSIEFHKLFTIPIASDEVNHYLNEEVSHNNFIKESLVLK